MPTEINSPVSQAGSNPTMFAHALFRGQALLTYSTGSISDGEQVLFNSNETAAAELNGLYMCILQDTADGFCFFTITSGTTVTVALDSGSSFGTTFENDTTFNIDVTSGSLRLNNELGSAITASVVKLAHF